MCELRRKKTGPSPKDKKTFWKEKKFSKGSRINLVGFYGWGGPQKKGLVVQKKKKVKVVERDKN